MAGWPDGAGLPGRPAGLDGPRQCGKKSVTVTSGHYAWDPYTAMLDVRCKTRFGASILDVLH